MPRASEPNLFPDQENKDIISFDFNNNKTNDDNTIDSTKLSKKRIS